MKLITLLEKGAEYLGMTFYSTIFENDPEWKDVIILPARYRALRDPKDDKFFGSTKPRFESKGYYDGSFGGLLREMITFFNAKINVVDNVISLERVDFNHSTANYKLPPVDQKKKKNNFEEWKSTYNLRFVIDETDTNTIDTYEGTVTNVVPRAPIVNNPDMTAYGGTPTEKVISFARGVRKQELTTPETFFNTILQALNPVINELEVALPPFVRSKIPSGGIVDLFGNRIGMLSLSSDSFTTNKLIMYRFGNSPADNKVSENNSVKVNTSYLYDNFHFVNSGVPTIDRPNANQWLRYTTRISACKEDLILIKNNNLIFTNDGEVAQIESFKWNTYTKIADIAYRVNKLFLNVEEDKDTPDGE
jgi:hypothetical protein